MKRLYCSIGRLRFQYNTANEHKHKHALTWRTSNGLDAWIRSWFYLTLAFYESVVANAQTQIPIVMFIAAVSWMLAHSVSATIGWKEKIMGILYLHNTNLVTQLITNENTNKRHVFHWKSIDCSKYKPWLLRRSLLKQHQSVSPNTICWHETRAPIKLKQLKRKHLRKSSRVHYE